MTNEEKADEIYPYYEDMTDLETFQTASRQISFIAGAEWKEQQMVEKVCEWIKDQVCYYYHWEVNGDTYENEIVVDSEKMIEDFKQAMMDE